MKFTTLAPMHLEKLVASGKQVYVLNTSVLPSGDKGMIVINFFDGTRREFFKMPPTFIPIAVTDSIPAKRLIESRDFKQSLVKGMLTLVDPDQAEQYLCTDEAREEYESLMLSEHSQKAKGVDYKQPTSRQQISENKEEYGPNQDVGAVDTVSNKVRALVESLKSGDVTGKQVKLELRRHQEALSHVDIAYIGANNTDPELSTYVNSLLPTQKSAIPVTASAPAKAKPAKAKPAKEGAFDFGGEDEMTPEEIAADAAARSRAMSEQAVNGQSKISDINAMLGKK